MIDVRSLSAMAAHILTANARTLVALEKGLDKLGEKIEKRAKKKIGVYQGATGPFEAWKELAQATKADRKRKGFAENDPLLRSGKLRASISRRTKGLETVIGSTSEIAVFQELGTLKIPPRPFLGPAAHESLADIEKIIGKKIVKALK